MNLIELQRALRQLRLGGMADVAEARLRQAQTEKMIPLDLLSTLVSDELLRRQDRLHERRIKLAGFLTYRVEQEADVEPMVESACRMAFGGGNLQIAILLSQRMIDRSHQGY